MAIVRLLQARSRGQVACLDHPVRQCLWDAPTRHLQSSSLLQVDLVIRPAGLPRQLARCPLSRHGICPALWVKQFPDTIGFTVRDRMLAHILGL